MYSLFHSDNGSLSLALNGFDHFTYFTGCTGSSLCKCTYFISNNSKTSSLLTCSCCFDSSVERQQVCLVSNIFNGADDGANLVASLTKTFYSFCCFLNLVSNLSHDPYSTLYNF